ncbi:hypothetical protein [Tropicibacter sp. S64]|uniref:hypothetical protein n=1 Tax=Tropicibacter sp. S64 TaxID=3415122 RepID=UPI003C7E52CD
MKVRVFRCKACNHRYRLGVSQCGYCFRPTALWNRWWVLLTAVVAGGWFAAKEFGLI